MISTARCLVFAALLLSAQSALAFCGFFVSSASTKLFNHASQVVLAHEGRRTVITMANDFKGAVTDFAVVVPVPTKLSREQIHVAERALIDHLDAYTAPRLVEYQDEDPCAVRMLKEADMAMAAAPAMSGKAERRARSQDVVIEARYTVGEYDILILSAKQSDGLISWLEQNGYQIPKGASAVVGSYLKQGMHFFVAKVNIQEQTRSGYEHLRPLQIAYEHDRFMLPIRLGTVNADGPQELFVYGLTGTGRIETTNYRTIRLPSDIDLPDFVQPEFAEFYRAMFGRQTQLNDGRVVFTEYAWDMNSCDPCAAEPMSNQELRQLGVNWLNVPVPIPVPMLLGRRGGFAPPSFSPPNVVGGVFVTRLHVRYDGAHFPEDLMFRETGDNQSFQGRYVLHHPFKGEATCPEARRYFAEDLPARQAQEAQQLADLTGWNLGRLRGQLPARAARVGATAADKAEPWWKTLWSD